MAEQGAFGSKVKITVSAALTTIANLIDFDPLTLRKTLVNMTGHDSASGYDVYVDTGKRSIPSLKLTLGWDDSNNTHQALIAGYNSTSPVNMSVEDPAGTEVITFSAFIQEISRVYKQTDGYKAIITIQPTGVPTLS